jgi:hypothetical protein
MFTQLTRIVPTIMLVKIQGKAPSVELNFAHTRY